MDPVTLIYYAGVCGLLGLFAPKLGGATARLIIGAIVGIAAVAMLPVVRSFL
ncbi:hypothetical protein [Oceanibium sediminis]|uniref:hypothetical protein n=1 Tax=Oceanibium sediminis TaxID=2026339 RepID=UPI0018E55E84|nr:hypothetical protein [Oceanibium sediminis]